MKNFYIIGIFLLLTLSCKAQRNTNNPTLPLQETIPVENYIDYYSGGVQIPDGSYFKDENNILDSYVGTWKGNNNNYIYEFVIDERTEVSTVRPITFDKLIMRYKITDANGTVLANTLYLPMDANLIIKGWYLEKMFPNYVLNYVGADSGCGQLGTIQITLKSNNTQMELVMYPDNYISSNVRCPNGAAIQIMPTELVTLTKQ